MLIHLDGHFLFYSNAVLSFVIYYVVIMKLIKHMKFNCEFFAICENTAIILSFLMNRYDCNLPYYDFTISKISNKERIKNENIYNCTNL